MKLDPVTAKVDQTRLHGYQKGKQSIIFFLRSQANRVVFRKSPMLRNHWLAIMTKLSSSCSAINCSISIYRFVEFCNTCKYRGGGGGAVAQSVERATPGEEVPGSIPPAPYWLGRCQYNVTG